MTNGEKVFGKFDPWLFAFDPGETTGFAAFNKDGEVISTVNIPNIIQGLESFFRNYRFIPKVVIIEDYRIFPAQLKAHILSRVPTLRVIGAIELWALSHKCEIIWHEVSVKNEGRKKFGIKDGNTVHDLWHYNDAVAHGKMYFHGLGKIKTPLELELEASLAMAANELNVKDTLTDG